MLAEEVTFREGSGRRWGEHENSNLIPRLIKRFDPSLRSNSFQKRDGDVNLFHDLVRSTYS